jgi:hypothetical protein
MVPGSEESLEIPPKGLGTTFLHFAHTVLCPRRFPEDVANVLFVHQVQVLTVVRNRCLSMKTMYGDLSFSRYLFGVTTSKGPATNQCYHITAPLSEHEYACCTG